MTVPARLSEALADRYAFERELGQGGMATVYLADDIRHQRKVAIKVLRPDLAATIGPDRFFREIRIAAQLQHPHILPLLESGEAAGFLFYVMPYVEGQSLRERLTRSGELPVHEAVRLLAEIVDALSYAHARGVVHRDVKPDNVMLSGRHALVMDFGVAKAVSEASGRNQLTTAGVALGTPAYMAPEQAAADPNLDHRVDIYAVGAMAYELLAGRPPFVAGTPQQVLAAQVTQAPEPLSVYRPGISPGLEAAVMRCLAKRPADRFQTADELHAQLESLVTPSGGMTPTGTRPVEGWKREGARRRWIPVAVAAVLGVAAVAWSLKPGAGGREIGPLSRTQITFTGNTQAPSLSSDGSRIAFAQRRCDSAGICKLDVVVQDVAGAGSAVIVRDAINVWYTEWTADDRYLLVGGSFDEDWGYYAVPVLGGRRVLLGRGSGSLLGAGDTTLITWALPGDSVAWVRQVGTATGVVHDSLAVAISGNAQPWVRATPDGRWLVVYSRTGRGSSISVADRAGVIRDSLVFPVGGYTTIEMPEGSNTILGFGVAPGGQDALEVFRHSIGNDGMIGPADTLIRNLDADWVGLSRNGDLLIGAGPVESSVHAFSWDGRSTASMKLQRLARMTSIQVTGSITGEGRQVLLVRDVPGSGSGLRQMSIMPFDSGPEMPLGGPLPLLDWDWGAPELFVAVGRDDSVDIAAVNPQSGRLERRRSFSGQEYQWVEGVQTGGAVVVTVGGQRIHTIGVPGIADTMLVVPPEAGLMFWGEPTPDGQSLVLAGWLPGEDSLGVHLLRLADGTLRRIGIIFGENLDTPRWLSDGSILLPVYETAWTTALYRVPSEGGPPERLGLLPISNGSYRFSADGRRGIIRVSERRTDAFVVRGFEAAVAR